MPTLAMHEQQRLQVLEATIRQGLKHFLAVGSALLEIREQKYYRITHKTFEDYIEERWGLSRQHAYRLINSATIVVEDLSPIGDKPSLESQVRPLSQLPREQRAEAWQEAVAETEGRPTAKAVQKAVERRLPEPKPEPETPRGKTRVNGVEQAAEPAIVAKLREAGRITGDVEITEPARTPEPEPEAEPEPETPDEAAWLAALPLSSRLTGQPLASFRRAAATFYRMKAARDSYRNVFRRVEPAAAREYRGAKADLFASIASRFLRTRDPRDWHACPPTDQGGCDATGHVPLIGECPMCKGYGFFIR